MALFISCHRHGRKRHLFLLMHFQGCGLVTMGSHEEAVAAIDALDSKHMWEGMESAMVVKWMDTALQRRRREQHLAAMRQGMLPQMGVGQIGMGGCLWLHACMLTKANYGCVSSGKCMANCSMGD